MERAAVPGPGLVVSTRTLTTRAGTQYSNAKCDRPSGYVRWRTQPELPPLSCRFRPKTARFARKSLRP
jgi:hypothetical protein